MLSRWEKVIKNPLPSKTLHLRFMNEKSVENEEKCMRGERKIIKIVWHFR